MPTSRGIVGIDLGTTHTVVASSPAESAAAPEVFPIPQLVAAGEVEQRPLLPSYLYAPLSDELPRDPAAEDDWVVGEYARRRGQEVPGRVVASAKSWLSHPSVDREAAILPWGSDDDAPRLSPVAASARLLRHVRGSWERAHPGQSLAEQTVILTVPASFDDVARELTVRAAQAAGLSVRLLEEPQAAFYDYLRRRGTAELEALLDDGASATATVLVCDVGGGTTDLTLIRVARAAQREGGELGGAPGAKLELERVAVGRHLLLGGDNIDLALAHWCEARLITAPERLDPARFGQLVLACRAAKEQLLSDDAPVALPIRILSRGAALVGGTLALDLPREVVEQVVFGGFLPLVEQGSRPRRARTGLVAFGLPYEQEPAVTRHVVEFLQRHCAAVPRAVLLNGGLFRAARAAQRLIEALTAWSGVQPTLLTHTDPDLAVARGAVAYGLALLGDGARIRGGAAHGYYIGVHDAQAPRRRALCVVPRGSAEGERHRVTSRALALRVGEPVRFELFASDSAGPHAPGQLVDVDEDAFDRLPPLVTAIDADAPRGAELHVALEGELSAIGTVDLSCVEITSQEQNARRFRLAFELRRDTDGDDSPEPTDSSLAEPRAAARAERRDVPPFGNAISAPRGQRFDDAIEAIERVFGKGRKDVKPREVKDLLRELERLLGERSEWTTELNRALFDVLAPKHAARRRSSDHERVYWMLSGFCLRPGFGHPKDSDRARSLAALFEQGLTFSDEARGWQQFWITWRRIAGGLDERTQIALRNLIDPFLAPEDMKLKKPKGARPQAADEMIQTASWLERIPAEGRATLGRWLLDRTWTDRDPRLWTAIGRVGARVPAYASIHHVIAPKHVERWLDHLLREKWTEMPSAPAAAVELARVTGDRARDISDGVRAEVARKLQSIQAPVEWITAVREFVPVPERQRAAWFGDDLPVGLRLID